MKRSIAIAVSASVLIIAGIACGQGGMLLDYAADKVIQKYQSSTCEELKAAKDEPKSDKAKAAIEFLRNDSQARIAFIDKVAAPVANKLFECGLIP